MLRLTWNQIFHEPGALFTIMVAFGLAFMVSRKAPVMLQIVMLAITVMYLPYRGATLLGQLWMWAVISGFVFEKLGLWYGMIAAVKGIRTRLESMAVGGGRADQKQDYSREPEYAYERTTDFGEREKSYQQAEAGYADRQQRRQQEASSRARTKVNQETEDFFRDFFGKDTQSKPKPPPKQKKPPPPQDPPPRTSSKKKSDWWDILEVPPTAPLPEVKKAWRRLSKKYHPDVLVNPTKSELLEAEEKMKEINNAYNERKERGS